MARTDKELDRDDLFDEIIPARVTHLSFQIDQFLEDFIRRGDHAGVGLETPLRGNHVDEALAKIDIRQLQRV